MDLVVLAGGKGRRMGKPKAFLKLHGKPVIDIVIDRLRPIFDNVIVASATGRAFPGMAFSEVADIYTGCGSLAGLHAGLTAAESDRIFAVACDMPFVNPELVRLILSNSAGYDVVIPVTSRNDSLPEGEESPYLEPLHGVYARTCLPFMEELMKQGNLRIFDFFPSVKARYIEPDEIRSVDPEMLSFFNINTPEEYERAREMLANGSASSDRTGPADE
jgi:molybdopterin-guanine dinucleotide biosynthesis protein A